MEFIGIVIAVLSTVPFLTFFLLFLLFRKWTGQLTQSTKRAADYSTVLFLIAVIALIDNLFQVVLIWEAVLVYTLLFTFVLTLQWRQKGEIVIIQAVRFVWRVSFVMLSIAYLLLGLIAIFIKM